MSDENASEIFISAFYTCDKFGLSDMCVGRKKKHTSYIIMPPVCVILYVKTD